MSNSQGEQPATLPIRPQMAAMDWLAHLSNEALADFVYDHLYIPLPAMDPVSAVLQEVITRLRDSGDHQEGRHAHGTP